MMSEKNNEGVVTVDDEDRISNLPDDVIGNILSRLVTVDAVATSILSKDWKDKWLRVYKIDINLHEYDNLPEEALRSIVHCLDKLFQCGSNVTKIHFQSYRGYFSDNLSGLALLISGFLKYKSEILYIDADDFEVVVPGRLLSWETLRELVLVSSFFEVPVDNCFPHLKTLRLQDLVISREEVKESNEIDNTMTLKFTFPVLETLAILRCVFPQVKLLVEIYSPCLQRIESQTIYSPCEEIKIFGATGPVIYESYGDYLDNIVFSRSNITSATYECGYDWDDEADVVRYKSGKIIKNLLSEFLSTVVDLKLSLDISQMFAKALLEAKYECHLPTFKKLERLFVTCWGNSESLFEILHATPFLKFLGIKLESGAWEDFDYDAMESIPSCLMSTLEVMEIHCDEYILEIGLLKFLLQIAAEAKLKRFHVEIKVLSEKRFNCHEFLKLISVPITPPHFSLCATNVLNRTKHFSYRQSCGWVEYV